MLMEGDDGRLSKGHDKRRSLGETCQPVGPMYRTGPSDCVRRSDLQVLAMYSIRFTIFALIVAAVTGCSRRSADRASSVTRAFGQRQFEQMLEDRPDMKEAIPSSHPVVAWVIDGFDGKRLGQRVHWSGYSPQSGRPAEHGRRYGSYPPYVSLSGGTETTALDKWALVVYEMFNLENNGFESLNSEALAGSLDADSYAEKCLELEFAAAQRTHEFFRANPLPASSHGRDEWYNWVSSALGTFEDYKKAYDVPGATSLNSNLEYFREHYEKVIVPYVDAVRSTKQ